MRPYATGVWGLTLLLQAKGVLGASISYSLPRAQRPEVDKEQVDKPGVGTYTLRKDLAADEVCSSAVAAVAADSAVAAVLLHSSHGPRRRLGKQ